ncbi:MAG: fumarylacetoacetate hydrolase family protein [Candidatus Thermoplasmatota archaeon]|nr:fumarylacetoacetate hydrolase family protein [Candidatus Thermoplasmatota archaeon]
MPNYTFKNGAIKDMPIGKIVCLARTYKKHAQEMQSEIPKDPIVFLKPATSVIFNKDSIIIPSESSYLHHEVEFGIVIGKKCSRMAKKFVLDYVSGYLVGLDITARDIQAEAKKNGWPWTISKGFDTFCPISEVISKDEITDPNNVDFSLKVNDEIKQKSNTKMLVFTIEKLTEFISHIMTLEKGDLILTGTPEGVGPIKEGDILKAELKGYCNLQVNVIKRGK